MDTDALRELTFTDSKDQLRFITCGSVGDGKSTLIGRFLHDSKAIYEDQLQALARDSVKHGTTGDAVDLALLVDGLEVEREQGHHHRCRLSLLHHAAPIVHGGRYARSRTIYA